MIINIVEKLVILVFGMYVVDEEEMEELINIIKVGVTCI